MGQLSFFDLSQRYEGLDVRDDPLVAIAAMVPFESFRPKLKAALIKGELFRTNGRNIIFAIASRSCGFSAWDSRMRFPTPRPCGYREALAKAGVWKIRAGERMGL
jgi:hypothetical protein